ncbi:hypothetical protein MJO28_007645 [Puccinia striiformis f. sp. tritici]|uniref:Uncharacterized protein n=1 Tax=Puccinia striiformis f. sp. tritici TaxID=168172 RepID=A0ACC0EFD6_9BASI|nr:hypothetical protein MJO28_007645 [Puccinia striiformis f. sp. tritici]
MKLEIVTVLEDQVERKSGFSPEGTQLVAQDHARALLNIEQQILKLEGGQVASGDKITTLVSYLVI